MTPSQQHRATAEEVEREASRYIVYKLGDRLWAGAPTYDKRHDQWRVAIHARGLSPDVVLDHLTLDASGAVVRTPSRRTLQRAVQRHQAQGDLLKIVRWASQKLASLIPGANWQQLVEEYEMGPEAEKRTEGTPPSQKLVLKLTSGALEGAEVERTSADRLVIILNRPVRAGSHLKLVTETGEELTWPVVRPLDRQGRAIYDVSGVSESPAFRLVLVEGEDSMASDK